MRKQTDMLLLALAIAPGLAICIFIFYRDIHDREPARHLVMSFFLGVVTTIPAIVLEMATKELAGHSVLGIVFSAFFFVALAEEFSKFLALRYYSFTRRSFDEPLDGIVYGVMVSMGFATLENVAYALNFGLSTAILRIFTAVPAHATFGIIMGYYIGKAKFDSARRGQLLWRGVAAATVAHGFFDAFLFLNENAWIHHYISKELAGLLLLVGALISLAVALVFSRRLLRLHRQTSRQLHTAAPVLTIRHASPADLSLIRTLALQIWPATYASILEPKQIRYMMEKLYSEEALLAQLQSSNQFIIVYNAGLPIGFASYGEIGAAVYKLNKIYLMQRQQGRGTGRFVIEQVIADIRPKQAAVLQLNVNRYNPAKGFYERLGFEVTGSEDIDIGGGYFMNDFIMEKRLHPLQPPS